VEFGAALALLGTLTREIIFVAVGMGILLALAAFVLIFRQKLGSLRKGLHVAQALFKTRVYLGDRLRGELTIENKSDVTLFILNVQAVAERGLSYEFSSSFHQLLQAGIMLNSQFTITPLARGRFRLSGFALSFTDTSDLFVGEVNCECSGLIEVYPGVGSTEPVSPLVLYGGSESLRKAATGIDFAGIREYAPGDEYHRVEWKATARLRKLMVKEFHPETETTLQILIDAGRTMHEQSYLGTKLDEAFAVARLLTESTVGSGNRIGIWIYNETEIIRALKPAMAKDQLPSLQQVALSLLEGAKSEELSAPVRPPRASWLVTPEIPHDVRVTMFLRLLRIKLGLGYRRTGVYRALAEAAGTSPKGFLVVLTDLQTDTDALLEAALIWRERGQATVAQIGAPWRLGPSLEEAYVKYQINRRILRRLQDLGLLVFDVQPERLMKAIIQHIGSMVFAPVSR
jgi:uncharacterized protein (DUF58 family)